MSEWTDDRIERLKTLWAEGCSSTEIAETLGGMITRNSVISKIHRLGAHKRDTLKYANQRRGGGRRKTGVKKPRRVKVWNDGNVMPADKSLAVYFDSLKRPDHLGLTLQQLEDDRSQCRYIHGDNKETPFTFCAQPVSGDSSYCAHHSMLCTRPYEQKKVAA